MSEHHDRLVYVDVGAAGGLGHKWQQFTDKLHVVLIEADQAQAQKLRGTIADYPSAEVVEGGLADADGQRLLHIARFRHCSSLLPPNPAELSRYNVATLFDVVGVQKVTCHRYDTLVRQGKAPAPEMLKIDVQGAEMLVLIGMGQLLQGVIGIELESHLYPIYQGQKLLGDIVGYLATHGLYLRKIAPQMNFDGDLVELNAYFTRRREELKQGQEPKLNLIESALGLQVYENGARLRERFGGGIPAGRKTLAS